MRHHPREPSLSNENDSSTGRLEVRTNKKNARPRAVLLRRLLETLGISALVPTWASQGFQEGSGAVFLKCGFLDGAVARWARRCCVYSAFCEQRKGQRRRESWKAYSSPERHQGTGGPQRALGVRDAAAVESRRPEGKKPRAGARNPENAPIGPLLGACAPVRQMIGEEKVAGKPALPSCHWSVASLSVKLLASATRSRRRIGLDCPPRPLGSSAPIGWREEAGIRAPRLLHWWAGKGGWAQRLVGGGPGLGRRGADWSESRLVVRHLGKAESRSGTEVPVYPRRTCRRRHRGIRVRVRARALAASHGECRHGCGQRPSRGVPSGVASSRAGAPPPPPPAAQPGSLEPCPTCPLPALKGPCDSQPPPGRGRLRPLKAPRPRTPIFPAWAARRAGEGWGGAPGTRSVGAPTFPVRTSPPGPGGGGPQPLKETAMPGGGDDPSPERAPGCIPGSF